MVDQKCQERLVVGASKYAISLLEGRINHYRLQFRRRSLKAIPKVRRKFVGVVPPSAYITRSNVRVGKSGSLNTTRGQSVLILDLLNIRASQYFNLVTFFHCEEFVVILK